MFQSLLYSAAIFSKTTSMGCMLSPVCYYCGFVGVQKLLLLFGAISSCLRHARLKMNKYKAASLNEAIQAIQGCLYSVISHKIFHAKSVRMQIGNLYDKK